MARFVEFKTSSGGFITVNPEYVVECVPRGGRTFIRTVGAPAGEECVLAEPYAEVAAKLGEAPPAPAACPRPTVVCLCGSTRFRAAFEQAAADETMAGRIFLTVGRFGHIDGLDMSGPDKQMLDDLHKRKIDLADEILVVAPGGYIGESTRGEIAYAEAHGKPVRYFKPEPAPSAATDIAAAVRVEVLPRVALTDREMSALNVADEALRLLLARGEPQYDRWQEAVLVIDAMLDSRLVANLAAPALTAEDVEALNESIVSLQALKHDSGPGGRAHYTRIIEALKALRARLGGDA